jgi:hypothetical protein
MTELCNGFVFDSDIKTVKISSLRPGDFFKTTPNHTCVGMAVDTSLLKTNILFPFVSISSDYPFVVDQLASDVDVFKLEIKSPMVFKNNMDYKIINSSKTCVGGIDYGSLFIYGGVAFLKTSQEPTSKKYVACVSIVNGGIVEFEKNTAIDLARFVDNTIICENG